MSYTSIDTCDACGRKIIVVNQAVGSNCVIAVCSHCAKRRPHIHDQCAIEDKIGIRDSMVIGSRIVNIKLPR